MTSLATEPAWLHPPFILSAPTVAPTRIVPVAIGPFSPLSWGALQAEACVCAAPGIAPHNNAEMITNIAKAFFIALSSSVFPTCKAGSRCIPQGKPPKLNLTIFCHSGSHNIASRNLFRWILNSRWNTCGFYGQTGLEEPQLNKICS